MNTLKEVVALQHARFLCHHSFLLAKFEEMFLLAIKRHLGLIIATQPLLLSL